jgi:nucleoside-diphosphate-sugar epimerase
MALLIIGCGYTGRRLAARLLEQGQIITGTVATEASAQVLRILGVKPVVADLDHPDTTLPLAGQDRIFYFAPPPGEGTTDVRLTQVLTQLQEQKLCPRMVYTSTTGVYGDCQGDWVTEQRPLHPTTDRARRRADAEQQLTTWAQENGGEAIILRVAGIYGPGRLPLERLRQGAPMIRAEEAPFSNRIHVDDLVTACLMAMDHGHSGLAYNVADGTPGTMAEYFNTLAELTGLPQPPAVTWDEAQKTMPPGLLSYLQESRRIDVLRLVCHLGVELKYPDLAAGLRASLDEENA